jgi:hypothetical protein
MTLYGATDPVVIGQPMSPFFGAQNGNGKAATAAGAAPIVPQPTSAPGVGTQATGIQVSLLEAVARGSIPRNAQISTIAGQAVSAGISALQGDGLTLDEALSSGNGAQVSLGVAVAPNAANPNSVTTMGVNNQIFVEGVANANDGLSTGPTPTNTESIVSAPVAGSTTTANVTLLTGVFQG